jgi:hypothetical protein
MLTKNIKWEGTLLSPKNDALAGILDVDRLRSLSLFMLSSESESEVRGGTSSYKSGEKIQYYTHTL